MVAVARVTDATDLMNDDGLPVERVLREPFAATVV